MYYQVTPHAEKTTVWTASNMIQDYKNQLRYWIATRIGDLETARQDHIAEIICPDCGMQTALDSTKREEQSCYFCGGNLIQSDTSTTAVERDSVQSVEESISASEPTTPFETPQSTEKETIQQVS